MSRPREFSDRRVTTAIRFDPDVHQRLSTAAAERDVSVNWLVDKAVRYYLDALIPIDELTLIRVPGQQEGGSEHH